jgi:1-acyl-sn-glycerol-3-phosphate acyltransferase
MSMLLARLRGLVVLVFGAVTMALIFFGSLPFMVLTGSGWLPMWLAKHVWAPCSLWLAGCRRVAEPLPPLPDGPLIFASNHESALDIWVLVEHLPRIVRFVAKAELFRIPVFGWYLRLGGHVRVDRGDRAQAISSLQAAARVVRAGTSLIVFPEGTRSRDARIQSFKKGPFALAMEAGVPVVPVAVSGSAAVTPRGLIAVHPGTIRVAVGEPLYPSQFTDRVALLTAVRERIIDLHVRIGGAGGDRGRPVAARSAPPARGVGGLAPLPPPRSP